MDITSEDFEWSAIGGRTVREARAASSASLEEAVESRWVEAAGNGDDEAFRRLVEFHQDRVFHFCHSWLRDEEEAREATQDTFVRAYGALGRYRRRAKFSTWLYRIALNQCRDRYRSRAGRQRRETTSFGNGYPELVCSGRKPDEASEGAEDLARLRRGIDALPESLRVVLILRALEGVEQDECAEILNCSIRAVEGRYYRARRALAAWWEANG